jgi:hypothetical protein
MENTSAQMAATGFDDEQDIVSNFLRFDKTARPISSRARTVAREFFVGVGRRVGDEIQMPFRRAIWRPLNAGQLIAAR